MFCRLSGVSDQVLPGVQRREEDQLVHPGRSVNTLFTFLSQPECLDEPKAAFLRSGQISTQAPAPPLLGQANPADKSGPSPCGRPLVARAITAPLGSPFTVCIGPWIIAFLLPEPSRFQIV